MAKFTKGNTASKGKGRPKGSGCYRAELRQAVDDGKFRALVNHLYTLAMGGDMTAAQVLVNRLVPPLRPKDEPIAVKLPDGDLLTQARAIVAAVAGGQMTPQDGKALLDGLAAVVKIQEITDLIPRLEALESQKP